MKVVLVFVDGLGLGPPDPAQNPLVVAETPTWRRLLGGKSLTDGVGPFVGAGVSLIPTDTTLGVPGFPQSATGQTALLTGQNAAQIMGRHYNAFPPRALREIISRHSLLKQVKEKGLRATFANMFTDDYFQRAAAKMVRHSVTTEATLAAGLALRRREDLLAGRAVYQDITNQVLRQRGYEVPLFTPQKGGRILAGLGREFDLTLFEYFRTDIVGHSQNWDQAIAVIELLDAFFGSLLDGVDLDKTLVVLASDHGNIEDLSVRTHTCNPAPTLLVGRWHGQVAEKIRSLTDIAPALLGLWG